MCISISSRFFASAVLIVSCLLLSGCASPKTTSSQTTTTDPTSFWKPYDLYLLASPHPRLYVEVDAVKGCEPSDATLQKLRDFLTTYCHKSEGIEIVRSDVIPIESAREVLPGALARKFINGPPDNSTSAPPAYMYVLFYNDDIIDKRIIETGRHPDPNPLPHPRPRERKPHVDSVPYPAMAFINTHYWYGVMPNERALHEAGHLLGLASRPTDAANHHCLSKNCLMNASINVNLPSLLLGQDPIKQRQLCEKCVAQLQESAKQQPPSNLRFVGPVLVRSEEGYHVLSLPNRVKLIVGNLTDQDCRDFAAAVHAENPSEASDNWRADGLMKEEMIRETAKTREILNRAKEDPYEPVRILAAERRAEQ
ncbi:hypothetical protein [Pedosphaera parvula]|uniref:Peptidase M43 pregnancy-associated plasma-A domain-containing protein n=1 Tax=Pedosphaera parvula (strain Ellin514) TaxID=320771 RepID=B9XEF5_PEDPL|nr:hypothetical protein [Pedosphaera parvula]EEF61669.1 hypothetical protein Cflav_PD4709 [Pedosphaera parvula Ellin514]